MIASARISIARPAFTLIEILIVVVILGILAAVVVPQFTRASNDAAETGTHYDVQRLRRVLEVYKVRNARLPDVQEGDGTWGALAGPTSEYLRGSPVNTWVGGANSRRIRFGAAPDTAYHQEYGWIYNPDTGEVWAASFDADDRPILPPHLGGPG